MSSKKRTKVTRNAQGQFAPAGGVTDIDPAPDIPTGPMEDVDHEPGMPHEADGVEGETQREGIEVEAAAPNTTPSTANNSQGDGTAHRPDS